MVLLGALLENWIIFILPERVEATFDYLLPASVGAVFVQLAMILRDAITTVAALGLALFTVFMFAPMFPAFEALGLPIVVVGTAIEAMIIVARKERSRGE